MIKQEKRAGAPRNNQNRKGKGTKAKKRIAVNMGISDRSEISSGVYVDLRKRFEDYLLDQGVQPTEDLIKKVARDWAYESWWQHLSRAEDEQAIIS
jgi:hypothetical protein